jgi:transcriptional regulator with XRE-family HTH domain
LIQSKIVGFYLPMEWDWKKFRGRFESRAKTLRLQQKDVAAKTSASAATISNWMTGVSSPRPEYFIEMATALDVTPGWLAFGDAEIPVAIKKFVDQFQSLPPLERALTEAYMNALQDRLNAPTPLAASGVDAAQPMTPAQKRFAELTPEQQHILRNIWIDPPSESASPTQPMVLKKDQNTSPPKL